MSALPVFRHPPEAKSYAIAASELAQGSLAKKHRSSSTIGGVLPPFRTKTELAKGRAKKMQEAVP